MTISHELAVIVGALAPIFETIILGYGLRRFGFPGETFWPAAERLTYFVLFPALLTHRLALAPLQNYAIGPLAAAIIVLLLVMSAVLFFLRPWLRVSGPVFSSIFQGSIRFNTYVGLAAAGALFQQSGLTVAALAIAILVPIINVLCVGVLSHATGALGVRALLRALLGNPLIIACVLGITLNFSGLGLPFGAADLLDVLARAALPLGLLAVGAGLRLQVAFDRPFELALASGLKLLVLPGMAWALARLIGLNGLETAILVLFAALPGATSAYILARQLGGDAELMAAIITVETALSMITLPVILLLII